MPILLLIELGAGVEKLADTVTKIANEDFTAKTETPLDQQNFLKSLQQNFTSIHKHFEIAEKQMKKLRTETQNKYKDSKCREATVKRNLEKLKTEIATIESDLRSQGMDLMMVTRDLKRARNVYNSAQREHKQAHERHLVAKKDEKYWNTVCWATVWIPFVGIGTCIKSGVTGCELHRTSELKIARFKYLETTTNLRNKAVKRLENKEKALRNRISQKDNIEKKIRNSTVEIKKLELENYLYAESVKDLQSLNTEVDLLARRSQTTLCKNFL